MLADIRRPEDLRRLTHAELDELGREIRAFLVESVCRTGGHLGPNLGVVELTLALHRVFDSPRDTILWDTGHQAYVHKLLTGRQDFSRLRRKGGLSGYPSRAESEHDVIENSHASTGLSYADGIAKAYRLGGVTDRSVVAVVGDGALTGGMAWEALNNVAAADRPVIIVLNDNGRSYSPTVGGLADHLTALRAGLSTGGAPPRGLFADLGLHYVGPVDGHDVAALEEALRVARDLDAPVVVHCVTRKGRGYSHAEADVRDCFHGVGTIDVVTGRPRAATAATWTSTFGDEMVVMGAERRDVVAVTAAMLHPVGLNRFAETHPDRVFDVGIAEQHAVTSAAGLAAAGLHPVVAVYATFLNRAFDQVLMDVALHRAGVTFVLDRAGATGEDGPSHNGMWDLSILQVVPGLRLAAPRDARQLRAQLREALDISDAPTVLRFPKGAVVDEIPAVRRVGDLDVLFEAEPGSRVLSDVLLISVGSMAVTCLEVARRLTAEGIAVTVVDPRWVKPISATVLALAASHRAVVVVEDNLRVGGVGSMIMQELCERDVAVPCRSFGIPLGFPPVSSCDELLEAAGLDASALTRRVARLVRRPQDRIESLAAVAAER